MNFDLRKGNDNLHTLEILDGYKLNEEKGKISGLCITLLIREAG